jgi:hypothetical protein
MINEYVLARAQRCGVTRRDFLSNLGIGVTGLAVSAMLANEEGVKAFSRTMTPPTGAPHHPPKAKQVVWFMMRGGVSHVESFDPKPALNKYAGKTISETTNLDVLTSPHLRNVKEQVKDNVVKYDKGKIWPLQIGYQKCGQSGAEVSDWWPHIRKCVDDIAIVRSMWTVDNNHGAQMQMMSGKHLLDGCAPTIGAWIHYGLGSLNDNFPQFIHIGPTLQTQCNEGVDGDYLGPENAAVQISVDPKAPLLFARPELDLPRAEQIERTDLLKELHRQAVVAYPNDDKMRARIKSYELAFRMQTSVPEIMRFSDETASTHRAYGLDNDVTRPFGEQCLATRRFLERGVRFIQVFHGDGPAGSWDAHSGLVQNHSSLSAQVDLPLAAFLQDLKQRGLLEETIVVWTTEFGRTPYAQGADGRDHHNFGFSVWLGGAGIKPGIVHGATDELGFHAVENRHFVTDLHATLFSLLGLDARRLEIPGRKRLDADYGKPIREIMS